MAELLWQRAAARAARSAPPAAALLALFGAPALADGLSLEQAVAAGDVAAARAALDQGASAHETLAYGESLLARAIETQQPRMVALLLGRGAKPNVADAEGLTPLVLACERGDAEIVGQLIEARADARRAVPDGTTPLATCARFSTAATVERMLAAGAKVDAPDSRGQTALMWAASAGKAQSAAMLLKAGARIDRTTKAGFTPLFFAIASGSAETTRLLLDAGADASHRGPENTSAPQLAAYQKNWDALRMLVERGGVDLAERDRNGEQLLHAAAAGGDEPLVALLLAKGADPNGLTGPSRITWVTEANFGMPPPPVPPTPPLLIAARHGNVPVMRALVAAGAQPAFVAANGTNVVLAAAAGRSAAALEEALAMAPDVNAADAAGATALHMVIGGGMHGELGAMLRVLADHGARADLADARGTTPTAMAQGGLATVKTLYDQVFGQKAAPMLAPALAEAHP